MPLLSQRSALILLFAVLCGIGAGILFGLGGDALPVAVVKGCGAFALALAFWNKVVSP